MIQKRKWHFFLAHVDTRTDIASVKEQIRDNFDPTNTVAYLLSGDAYSFGSMNLCLDLYEFLKSYGITIKNSNFASNSYRSFAIKTKTGEIYISINRDPIDYDSSTIRRMQKLWYKRSLRPIDCIYRGIE